MQAKLKGSQSAKKITSEGNKTKSQPFILPEVGDFKNKSFKNLLDAVEISGFMLKLDQTQSGSHINQYVIEATDKNGQVKKISLNLQKDNEGHAKTYQIHHYIKALRDYNEFIETGQVQEISFDSKIEELFAGLTADDYTNNDLLNILELYRLEFENMDNTITNIKNYSKFIEALTQKIEQALSANPPIYDEAKQKILLQNYVFLLQKCDHINQSNKRVTPFQMSSIILNAVKQNFQAEFAQLKAKMGEELADEGNYVLSTLDGKELYLFTPDPKNKNSKLTNIDPNKYDKLLDVQMNYTTNSDQPELTTLRNILQGETGAVSKLRLRVPADSIKTITFKGFQNHYATLPEKYTEPGDKSYSEIFIYDDKSLPNALLEQTFGSDIAIGKPCYANINPTKDDPTKVDIKVPPLTVLLKKSLVTTTGKDFSKMEHGFIITAYAIDANDKQVEKHNFIQKNIPANKHPEKFKGCDLTNLQHGFIVIPTNQIQLIEKFKQDVKNFSFNTFNFDDEIINLITKSNLSLISMKDLCVKVSANTNNNQTKFLCEIIVKLLDKNKKILFDVNDILQLQLKYDGELMEFSDDKIKQKVDLYFSNDIDGIQWRMEKLFILEMNFDQKFNDKAKFWLELFIKEWNPNEYVILSFIKIIEAGYLDKVIEVIFENTKIFDKIFMINFLSLLKSLVNSNFKNSFNIITKLTSIIKEDEFIKFFELFDDELSYSIILNIDYLLIACSISLQDFVLFLDQVSRFEKSKLADVALISKKCYLAFFKEGKLDIDDIVNQLKKLCNEKKVSEELYTQLFERFSLLLTSKGYELNLEILVTIFSDTKYIPNSFNKYQGENKIFMMRPYHDTSNQLEEITQLINEKKTKLNKVKLLADKLPWSSEKYISKDHYLFAIYVKSVLQLLFRDNFDEYARKELDAIFNGKNYELESKVTVACLYLSIYSKDYKKNKKVIIDLYDKVFSMIINVPTYNSQLAIVFGLELLSLGPAKLSTVKKNYDPICYRLIFIKYALYARDVDKEVITDIIGWFIESIDANNSAQKNEDQELFIYLTMKWVKSADTSSVKFIKNAFRTKNTSMDDAFSRARELLTKSDIKYELLASGVISAGFYKV